MIQRQRTIQELRKQYEVEKRLAQDLKSASKAERRSLYSKSYDELLNAIPHFPQLSRLNDVQALAREIRMQMNFVKRFISPETTFLELGAGYCRFALALALQVKKVYAVEVSNIITKGLQKPSNFELIISDGVNVPVAAESIDLAYSHQCIEHIHPDDLIEHLQGIFRALIKGGIFICATPHRFSGPHDISKYFDRAASGLHLKEYTNTELYRLFKSAGFSSVKAYLSAKLHVLFPLWPIMCVEAVLYLLPYMVRKLLAKTLFRRLLGIYLIAVK